MNSSEYPNAYRYRRIVQAKRFIDEHFAEDIDLGLISDEAHFSKFHFLRLFKNAYGKTPNRYLIECRIKYACKLLQGDRLSVSEVCFEVGFESIGSFSSLFKRELKSSPAQYRRESHEKKERVAVKPKSVVPSCFVQAFY
ncbi:MAG: AraC family transcriptional regulator [Balneolaceae bacterium]|jgi:AraC-like DNA-binding protein